MAAWWIFVHFAIMASTVTGQPCTQSLLQNCSCVLEADEQVNITCEGNDIVNITKQLPPSTIFFQYKAMELFVNLGLTDFSHVPLLKTLLIQDIGDYSVLKRKISPITGEAKMFGNLANLRVLAININWAMGYTTSRHFPRFDPSGDS